MAKLCGFLEDALRIARSSWGGANMPQNLHSETSLRGGNHARLGSVRRRFCCRRFHRSSLDSLREGKSTARLPKAALLATPYSPMGAAPEESPKRNVGSNFPTGVNTYLISSSNVPDHENSHLLRGRIVSSGRFPTPSYRM